MVDAADQNRLEEARTELDQLLIMEELKDVPVVVFGNKVDIAIENNNFYPTDAYRDVTDAKFISEIVSENNIKFLFDIAHAKVTCFNKNINFERYKSNLPMDRAV